jgi:hypothetical protein
MTKPLLIDVELSNIVTADQLAAAIWTANLGGTIKGPRLSTLNNIRARARAVRPL